MGKYLGLLLACVALALGIFYNHQRHSPPAIPETSAIPVDRNEKAMLSNLVVELPMATNAALTPKAIWGSREMSPDERLKLSEIFTNKFQPAAERWFAAYGQSIPFALEEFTLEKFHSRVGTHMYTFMIGTTTFTLQDFKDGAKVSYLMTRKAAKELGRNPGPGFVPDLRMSVTREEIIEMVKKDSGVVFTPNEVLLKPTGAATTFNSGAFVDILPLGKDPNNALNYKLSMVFDADGKLANYERDPSF